jgi:hypothetical protein
MMRRRGATTPRAKLYRPAGDVDHRARALFLTVLALPFGRDSDARAVVFLADVFPVDVPFDMDRLDATLPFASVAAARREPFSPAGSDFGRERFAGAESDIDSRFAASSSCRCSVPIMRPSDSADRSSSDSSSRACDFRADCAFERAIHYLLPGGLPSRKVEQLTGQSGLSPAHRCG